MIKKLIQGVGVTAVCLQLALLPIKAADPAVSLTKDGNNIRADLELTESTKNSDVVSLKLSFEVDKKPSESDVRFEFDNGIASQVKEYRYHPESGRLNIYISGDKKLFEEEADKFTLGTVVFSNNVKGATVSVVTDSFVTVNDAFHMEEIKLPESSASQGNDNSGSGGSGGSGGSSGSGSGGSGGSGGSSSSSSSNKTTTSSSSSYENRNTLSSTEAAAVSTAASQMFGTVSAVQRVEKTTNGICIISKGNQVIFLKNNGELAKNEWQLSGADWYYFDADKKAASGWKTLGGKWYYLNNNSKKMEKGWMKSSTGKWYYLDEKNGDMQTGWKKVNNRWYFMDTGNGDMKTGWQSINGKWYFLDSVNGDMKSDWQLINGKWYFLDSVNGDMKTGWQQIRGKWYYMNPVNGDCLMNTTTPDGYTVDENGVWTP